MASLNQCNFIGNLGRDPETKFMPNGEPVCNFSIAVSETWRDKNSGEKKESTEWVRVVVYGKLAEVCGQYLKKGSSVFISAKCKTRKWTDKDGAEKYTTEFVASEMKMLGGKSDGASQGGGQQPAPQQRQQAPAPQQRQAPAQPQGNFDDDIPF